MISALLYTLSVLVGYWQFVYIRENENILPKHGKIGFVSGSLTPAQKALVTDLDDSGRAVIVIMDELDEDSNIYMELEANPPEPVSLQVFVKCLF